MYRCCTVFVLLFYRLNNCVELRVNVGDSIDAVCFVVVNSHSVMHQIHKHTFKLLEKRDSFLVSGTRYIFIFMSFTYRNRKYRIVVSLAVIETQNHRLKR